MLGTALLAGGGLDPAEYPLVADHLVRAGAEELLPSLHARHLQAAPGRVPPRQDELLAQAMLGEHATRERVKRLLQSRPLMRRIDARIWLPAAGLSVLAMAGAIYVRGTGGGPPTRIAFAVAPVEADPTLNPSPVIELQDDEGRRAVSAEDSVYVEVASGPARLAGRTAQRAHHGLATFDALDLMRSDAVRDSGTQVVLRFRAPGLPPIEWSPTALPSPTLFLEDGTVDGQVVAPPNPTIAVRPGDSIIADLHLRYTSPWSAASVLLGGTPTWGDKRTSYFTLKPLVTPVEDGRLHVAIRLPGPSRPGRYHLILFFQAETDVRFIASGTNWTMGRPVWNDGNDVADWTLAQIARANASGQTPNRVLRMPQGTSVASVPATAIEVVVK